MMFLQINIICCQCYSVLFMMTWTAAELSSGGGECGGEGLPEVYIKD